MFERDFGEGAFDDGPDEIERLCQEALTQFEDGEVAAARERAMEAVSLDDEHPFPMFVLALVAEFEGDISSARDFSELALRTAATNADAIQMRAQVHMREFEFEQAEQLLRFGILHNPDDAVLHEGLARVLLATGRAGEALRAAQSALRLDSSSTGALAVRSATLDALDDPEGALAAMRHTVQLHPDDPYATVELATLEAERGNLARARTLLARAQRLRPDDLHVREARMMIERAHSSTLLRPLPGVVAWVREFPGGMPGFLLGFVIAALPLHALVQAAPPWALAAWLVMGAWAAAAVYVWIGPAVLSRQLSRIASQAAVEDLYDEIATAETTGLDIDRVLDVAHLQLHAGRRAGAVETLRVAATAVDPAVADALLVIARRLDRRTRRLLGLALAVPAAGRALVAVAAALFVAGPLLASPGPLLPWYAAAAGCLAAAFALSWLERLQSAPLTGLTLTSVAPAIENRHAHDVA